MPDNNHIFLGVEGTGFQIDPLNADLAFQAALNLLASSAPQGGDLYVLPGMAKYLFQAPVLINSDNVTIHFSSGAILDFHSTFNPGTAPPALFVIQKRNFRCVGLRVEHMAVSGASAAGRSCVLVSDPANAPRDSDGATFEDCQFKIGQGGPDVRWFTCIRATGASSSNPRRGLLVARSSFMMMAGSAQTLAWNGFDPYGICGVRAFRSAETMINSGRFVGDPSAPSGTGRCGPMVYLDDAPENVISSSIFRKLDLSLVPAGEFPDPPVLIRIRGQDEEGHHTLITANIVEEVNAYWLVELDDVHYDVLVANRFGNYGSLCEAVVATTSRKGPNFRGTTLVLGGNAFRDVPQGVAKMVHLSQLNNVTIGGGAYSQCR